MSQEPRQPPKFVPTLKHMVQPAPKSEVAPVASTAIPAAFAELLKDWPSLGEPATPAEQAPGLAASAEEKRNEVAVAEHPVQLHVEQLAQRAEALVLQRLPALMAGLVASAVRDAMAEMETADAQQPEPRQPI